MRTVVSLSRLCKCSRAEFVTLAEAVILLAFASFTIRFLPFHMVTRLTGGTGIVCKKGCRPGW